MSDRIIPTHEHTTMQAHKKEAQKGSRNYKTLMLFYLRVLSGYFLNIAYFQIGAIWILKG